MMRTGIKRKETLLYAPLRVIAKKKDGSNKMSVDSNLVETSSNAQTSTNAVIHRKYVAIFNAASTMNPHLLSK